MTADKKGLFITGTDTDIGKTVTCAMMIAAAIAQGIDIRYFKPLQTGDIHDCPTVKMLAGLTDTHIIQPVYTFAQPKAPYLAALLENQSIDLDAVIAHWHKLPNSFYLIEGAGGLLVPIATQKTTRDLIARLFCPLIIVASTRLGTMNHTLLTIEAAKAAGICIKGIILVGDEDKDLRRILEQFSNVPVLCTIPWLPKKIPHDALISCNYSLRRPAACPRDPDKISTETGSRGQAAGRRGKGLAATIPFSLNAFKKQAIHTFTPEILHRLFT